MIKEKTAPIEGGKEKGIKKPDCNKSLGNNPSLHENNSIISNKAKLTATDTTSQRLRLLRYLQDNGSVTTDSARHELAIFCPAPRIKELRQAGYKIETIRYSGICLDGVKRYRMARYVLTIGGGNE